MNSHTTTRRWNTWIVLACVFTFVVGAVVVLFVSPRNAFSGPVGQNATAAQYNDQREQTAGLTLPLTHLEGRWYMKEDATAFIATVSGNSIKIEMLTGDDISSTYWHGTFETAEAPGKVITSTKTEAREEIVLAQGTTKDFTIGTDSITFKFSALGFSKNVELRR